MSRIRLTDRVIAARVEREQTASLRPRRVIQERDGVNVVVDPFSVPYLQGATVDFLTGLQESGFKIDNPNAASSCGCGHSFQVEEGAEGEAAPDAAVGGCGSGCSH